MDYTTDISIKDICKEVISTKPLVGRESELAKMIEVMARKDKNNFVLIGEAGVGKTALVEELSNRINKGLLPFCKKKIYQLDVGQLMTGTKYRGELEEKISKLFEEIQKINGILFIDDLELIAKEDSNGSNKVVDFLKSTLRQGKLEVIACCNTSTWLRDISKAEGFAKLFQTILVKEPSTDETLEILNGLKESFEKFHNVTYSQDILKSIISLSNRYMTNHYFPDKAIDILDQAGVYVKVNKGSKKEPREIQLLEEKIKELVLEEKYEEASTLNKKLNLVRVSTISLETLEVTKEDVEITIENMTTIPISSLEKESLDIMINLRDTISSEVIGQEQAVEKVVTAIQRSRLKLSSDKPASIMCIGTTGVGKTELAKSVAKNYYNNKFLRLDMNKYKDPHSISSLLGPPPGYKGHEMGGELTNYISVNPYSIILLDEIEKAHPQIFDLFLQILDEGYIVDSKGVKINFKNTIILMSSNIGVKDFKEKRISAGFLKSDSSKEEELMKSLHKFFRPEFINRIDDIVVFNDLSKEALNKIVDLKLNGFINRCNNSGFSIQISDKAKELLLEKGYEPEFGARPLNRAISELESLVSSNYFSTGSRSLVIDSDGTSYICN